MVLSQPVAVVGVVDAAHPGDTGPLETWLDANPLANVLCILGKTEGNGCVNDHTRGYATSAIKDALRRVQSRRIERASADMRRTHPGLYDGMEDAAIIMSGGTEGEHSSKTALNFVSTQHPYIPHHPQESCAPTLSCSRTHTTRRTRTKLRPRTRTHGSSSS